MLNLTHREPYDDGGGGGGGGGDGQYVWVFMAVWLTVSLLDENIKTNEKGRKRCDHRWSIVAVAEVQSTDVHCNEHTADTDTGKIVCVIGW
mgnify:CR=1 FL=1